MSRVHYSHLILWYILGFETMPRPVIHRTRILSLKNLTSMINRIKIISSKLWYLDIDRFWMEMHEWNVMSRKFISSPRLCSFKKVQMRLTTHSFLPAIPPTPFHSGYYNHFKHKLSSFTLVLDILLIGIYDSRNHVHALQTDSKVAATKSPWEKLGKVFELSDFIH